MTESQGIFLPPPILTAVVPPYRTEARGLYFPLWGKPSSGTNASGQVAHLSNMTQFLPASRMFKPRSFHSLDVAAAEASLRDVPSSSPMCTALA